MFEELVGRYVDFSSDEMLEISSYFDLIEDLDERSKLQDLVVKSLQGSIHREKKVIGARLTLLHCMFNAIGLNLRLSKKAQSCSKLLCKRMIEFYRDSGYRTFDITNRFFMYEIEAIDESIIDGVRAYFCSGFAGDNVINNFHRSTDFSVFSEKVDELCRLYPCENRNRLAEYALYYTEDKVSLRTSNKMFLDKIRELIDGNIDFFEVSDRILSSNKRVGVADIDIYLKNLKILRDIYGPNVENSMSNGDLNFIDMTVMVHGIKYDIVLPLSYYLDKPLVSREYILWKSDNLPIEKYVAMGYRRPSQLNIIRKVVSRGIDIRRLGINPSMSSVAIKTQVEKSGIDIESNGSCNY